MLFNTPCSESSYVHVSQNQPKCILPKVLSISLASLDENPGREVELHCGCGPLGLSFMVITAYISLLVVVLLLDTESCVVSCAWNSVIL